MGRAAGLTLGIIFLLICLASPMIVFLGSILLFLTFWFYHWSRAKKGLGTDIPRTVNGGILIFYGMVLAAVILNRDMTALVLWLMYAVYALFFYMTAAMGHRYSVKEGALRGIAVGAAGACLYGLFRWTTQPEGTRIDSFYLHPNQFGFMIELMIPALVYSLFYFQRKAEKIIIATILGALFFCLILTESRGTVMGLSFGSAGSLVLWTLCRRKCMTKQMRRRFIGAAVLILAVGISMIYGLGSHRVEQGEVHPGGERVMMLQASFDMWKDHPLSGVGLSHWKENYYGDYRPAESREEGLKMPHNVFMYFLSTAGLLGGAGYILYVVCLGLGTYRAGVDSGDAALAVTLWTVLASFTIHGPVDMANPPGYFLYYGLFGLFLSECRRQAHKRAAGGVGLSAVKNGCDAQGKCV